MYADIIQGSDGYPIFDCFVIAARGESVKLAKSRGQQMNNFNYGIPKPRTHFIFVFHLCCARSKHEFEECINTALKNEKITES